MSYIPLPIVISAMIDPLRHCLRDQDPYVRKTAAICVAKLFVYDPRMVDKEGFINMLRDLLADTNPTVVANAVAALTEISERSDEISLKLNLGVANKLILAMADCSEYVDCLEPVTKRHTDSCLIDGRRFTSLIHYCPSSPRHHSMPKAYATV